MRHFCTYFDCRFLTRGLALHRSLRQHCPQSVLWVLCLDTVTHDALTELAPEGLRLISHEEFVRGDELLESARADRSLVEYYFTCSPSLPLFILARQPEVGLITYLDADLYFFSSPEPLFEEMGDCSIAITPHRFSPALQDHVIYGLYNVAWLSFRRDPVALGCLKWWREQCLEWCHDRVEDGKFADQKYLDQWPALFGSVAVLAHPGANLAAWNLAGVRLGYGDQGLTVNDRPLIFYHFHNLKKINSVIYQTPFDIYRVKPPRLMLRRILSPYLRVLAEVERQERTWLPSICSVHDIRYQNHQADSGGAWLRRVVRRVKHWCGLLRGIITGKYYLYWGGSARCD